LPGLLETADLSLPSLLDDTAAYKKVTMRGKKDGTYLPFTCFVALRKGGSLPVCHLGLKWWGRLSRLTPRLGVP
jgi:hypothetical protein